MTANPERDGREGLTAEMWWTVDRSHEPPLQVGATPLVEKCMLEHGWSLEFTLQVLDGYKKLLTFMLMFQDYNSKKFYPPIPIDKMWLQHAQDNSNYAQDCQLLFSQVIARRDTNEELDEETKNRRIDRTLYVLRLQCQEDYDRAVWDFGREASADSKSGRVGLRPRTNRVDWSKKLANVESSIPTTRKAPKRRNHSETSLERRRTQDGCVRPAREPKQNPDGTFRKPVGRLPQGMVWDTHRGLYAPKENVMGAQAAETPSAVKRRKISEGSYRPARAPKKNADGSYAQPCGRVPYGMTWDKTRGLYTPTHNGLVDTSPIGVPSATPSMEKTPRAPKKNTIDAKRKAHSKSRKTDDGCFRPASKPRQAADGTFIRPPGRGPVGLVWDARRGLFAPTNQPPSSMTAAQTVTSAAVTPDISIAGAGGIYHVASSNRKGTLLPRNIAHEEAKG